MLGALVSAATSAAQQIVGHFFPGEPTPEQEAQRAADVLVMEKLILDHDATMAEAQRDVLVAELTQGDNFTKRARPWMIYSGLIVIAYNTIVVSLLNGIVALFGNEPAFVQLPVEPMFWTAWGGATSLYVWNRDRTKQRGMALARNV